MIITRSRPTLEGFKKYWWSKPTSVIHLVTFCILVAFNSVNLIAAALVTLLTGEDIFYLAAAAVLLAFGIFCIVWQCRTPRRLYNMSQRLCSDVVETITFGDDSFITENVGSKINERVENAYSSVSSAKLSGGWFVIICDKYRFYVFRTNEFAEGTPEELCRLLREKLGSKFKEGK